MTTMLRYARYLKKLNRIGWKVIINQQIYLVGGELLVQNRPTAFNLIKSYATTTAVKPVTIYRNVQKFQSLETQLKRSGKVSKTEITELLAEVQTFDTISSLDALLLIRGCGKSLQEAGPKESIDLVQEIWDTLEGLNASIDVSHVNALLNVYIEKDHNFSSSQFLDMMKKKGIEPNRVTYQRFIRNYCHKGDIAGATNVLEMMKEKGYPLCEDVFNSLIVGHSEANDMENAEKILKIMEGAGISPSAETYAELMYAYAKRGNLDSTLNTLDILQKQDIFLLDKHYMDILYAFAANNHTAQANEFFKIFPSDIHSDLECSRVLIKLIFANQLDLALKVLTETTSDVTRQKMRAIAIVKAVIKNRQPVEDIIKLCKHLEEKTQYNQAFSIALYTLFKTDLNPDVGLPILKCWSVTGTEIRDHYFWPLLVNHSKVGDMKGIQNVLKSMIDDFNIMPSFETLRNYVLPYMFGTWEHVIGLLVPLNIPKESIYMAIVDRLLLERKLKNAALFMTSHPSTYPKEIFLRHLAEALSAREDAIPFIVAVRNLCEDGEAADLDKTPVSVVDSALIEVMAVIPHYRSNIMLRVLEELVASRLSISSKVAEEIKRYLGDNLRNEDVERLDNLASGTLTSVPITEYNRSLVNIQEYTPRIINAEKLMKLRTTFAFHLEKHDPKQILVTLQHMTAAGYVSAAVFAQAISIFCDTENLKAAEECMQQLKEKLPDAILDFKKIVQYAELLIKHNRFVDAIDFLSAQRDANRIEKLSRGLLFAVTNILETTAEQKNTENLTQLFNLLRSKNYVKIDKLTLTPLVKIHILRDDLQNALDSFERVCMDYQCTPYKHQLTKAFIEKEDANSLQRITDLSAKIYGESNALIDLGFSFLEHGKLRQAQKIFGTRNLQIVNAKISMAIEKFVKYDRYECLEKIVEVTKGTERMDRSYLYYSILNVYNKHNDFKAGLALWTDMQEDNVQPTTNFLNTLSQLLKNNNQQVPFANDANINREEKIRTIVKSAEESEFDLAVDQKNYDYAERLLNSGVWKARKNILNYNFLILCLLEDNNHQRALSTAKTLLEKYSTISQKAFSELIQQLLENKRFDDIKKIGTFINEETKTRLKFSKVLSAVEVYEKGLTHFMQNVTCNSSIDNKSDYRSFEKNIHFGSVVHSLLENPNLIEEFEKWASELWKAGIHRGMQPLWNYYYITNDRRELQFYDKYISSTPSPLVKPIIDVARKRKDEDMLKQLLKRLESRSQLSLNVRSLLYTGLIRIYVEKGLYDEGVCALRELTQHYRLTVIPNAVLRVLGRKYEEKTGKKFPFIAKIQRRNIETHENDNDQQNESLEKVSM